MAVTTMTWTVENDGKDWAVGNVPRKVQGSGGHGLKPWNSYFILHHSTLLSSTQPYSTLSSSFQTTLLGTGALRS